MTPAAELMIVAGEASGDLHAGRLVGELLRRHENWRFFGCGGEGLRAAGCELLVDAADLAVVGLFEVGLHLPRIYRRYRRLCTALKRRRPSCLILVDFPDFNLRLAKVAARLGVPVVYFISPQVWAWRPGRVEAIRRTVRRMICIFPFEAAFYAAHGVTVDYVGHPLVDLVRCSAEALEFRRRLPVGAGPLIALLPGSRRREIAFHLPVMLQAAQRLHAQRGVAFVIPAASTVGSPLIAAAIPAEQRAYVHIVDGQAYDALGHARLAIVASGTATVEAALLRTPMAVVYRLSNWSYRLGRRWVKAPYFAMVNLIAGRAVVPELIQEGFHADAVVNWALKLLDESAEREAMLRGLDDVRARLGQPGAIARAADVVDEVLGRPHTTPHSTYSLPGSHSA